MTYFSRLIAFHLRGHPPDFQRTFHLIYVIFKRNKVFINHRQLQPETSITVKTILEPTLYIILFFGRGRKLTLGSLLSAHWKVYFSPHYSKIFKNQFLELRWPSDFNTDNSLVLSCAWKIYMDSIDSLLFSDACISTCLETD